MAVSNTFLDYVLEQLAGLPRLRSKRMFGGVGIYSDERFFALLDDNCLYLKVDDDSRGDFVARGMKPFQPYPDKPETTMGYYQVPADVLEDAELLAAWARKALRVVEVRRRPARARTRRR